MGFLDNLDNLFPPYLSETSKGRLKDGFKQFREENTVDKIYTHFYNKKKFDFFLQGDLLKEIRFPVFEKSKGQYSKMYFDALVISNTCDIDSTNPRKMPKNVLLAKAILLEDYITNLSENNIENIPDKVKQIKNQNYSNLLYLPPTSDGSEYIVPLDYISQITTEELNMLKEDIDKNRIEVLDQFGFYLFMFKLSFHFCRLPEDMHRS